MANAGFGFDANGMGDINGDGRFDYLVTAASDSGSRGMVYVLAGNIATPRAGDVNRDDFVDFADIVALLAAWASALRRPPSVPPTSTAAEPSGSRTSLRSSRTGRRGKARRHGGTEDGTKARTGRVGEHRGVRERFSGLACGRVPGGRPTGRRASFLF